MDQSHLWRIVSCMPKIEDKLAAEIMRRTYIKDMSNITDAKKCHTRYIAVATKEPMSPLEGQMVQQVPKVGRWLSTIPMSLAEIAAWQTAELTLANELPEPKSGEIKVGYKAWIEHGPFIHRKLSITAIDPFTRRLTGTINIMNKDRQIVVPMSDMIQDPAERDILKAKEAPGLLK